MLKDLSDRPQPDVEPFTPSVAEAPSLEQPLPMLRQIAQLCSNAFAEYCAIYLRGSSTRPVVWSSRRGVAEGLDEAPYDELLAERLRKAGFEHQVIETLTTANHPVGWLVLASSDEQPSLNPGIVPTLSFILATLIEQARQLAHHFAVSSRLQRALLPSSLAQAPGLRFDAAYRPADLETEVGGDWYDAFEIGNGTIGISIGDVTGHGLEAAVAMSEIRRSIRSSAVGHDSPSAILNRVDEIVTSEAIGMATALVGLYDPATGVLRYSCAGHPAPILVSGRGRPVPLPGGGLLVGLGMRPASSDWTLTLGSGSSCYFFTDGLLEYSRDIVAGERALFAALERLHASSRPPSAEDLHHSIFAEVHNTDDAATLVMHRERAPEDSLVLSYSAVPQFAPLAREVLRSFATNLGFSNDSLFDFLAATGEAIANAIEHGSHEEASSFDISAHLVGDSVIVDINNHGHWRVFTPREERGRGIPIMRACTRAVEVSSTHERTSVRLTFKRNRRSD